MLRPVQYKFFLVIVAAMLLDFGALGWRLYDIQVRRHAALEKLAKSNTRVARPLVPWRGGFLDRNGTKVGMSIPEKTVWLDLGACGEDVDAVAATCGRLLGIPCDQIAEHIRWARGHFRPGGHAPATIIVLKRHLPIAEWAAVASAVRLEPFGFDVSRLSKSDRAKLERLRHHLLSATDSQARRYPYRDTLAQVVGFSALATNGIGLEGKCGLEKKYDAELSGVVGEIVSEQDAAGRELPARRFLYRPASNGCNIQLTIDLPLQQTVEQTLIAAVAQARAKRGSAVIMDPRTFEILAMVSVPGFNPEDPGAVSPANWPSPCMGAMVEPGSVAKIFTLAAALEAGLVTLDSSVDCEHGQWSYHGSHVKDHASLGVLTVREAFAKSSNIGFAKIGLCLGPERLYHSLTNFGLGRPPAVPFFGAAAGSVISPTDRSVVDLTRAAFGQGFAVSQMQMAIAMCIIANDGRLCRPLLVRQIESADGKVLRRFAPQFVRVVVSPVIARQVREACKAAVAPNGTGALAASPFYSCGAKTGTAQKSDGHRYLPDAYYSSMVGFLPADSPRLVIAVAIDEPRNGYYASSVVAPAFRTVAEQSAARLGIQPDRVLASRGGRGLVQGQSPPPNHVPEPSPVVLAAL